MLNYFDVVVTILNIESLTALGPIEEGHIFILFHPASQSLPTAVLGEADEEHLPFPKLDQLLLAEDLPNCGLEHFNHIDCNTYIQIDYLSGPIMTHDEFERMSRPDAFSLLRRQKKKSRSSSTKMAACCVLMDLENISCLLKLPHF